MFRNKRKQKRNEGGFSLVETLVAITILLVAITGPIAIASQSIKIARFAKNQMVAVFLVQEAVESLIKLREEDFLDGGNTWDWVTVDLPSACTGAGCGYSAHNESHTTSCATPSNCQLRFNESPSPGEVFYSHDSGVSTLSPFTRIITVDDTISGQAAVTVIVSWQSGLFGGIKTETLETTIFDIY